MCLFVGDNSEAASAHSEFATASTMQDGEVENGIILPGLPDDVAKQCLALVPRCNFPEMGGVCKQWRSVLQSKEFLTIREETGKVEEWLYVLTGDVDGKGSHWEVLSSLKSGKLSVPPMPGPEKEGFGIVVVDGKLVIIAGNVVHSGGECVSADVHQYDSRLNRWSVLAKMNVARREFACAEVGGLVYAVGGYGSSGECLSSAEVYHPDRNEWTLIPGPRRPRWGCFACGVAGKLYVMGGRSRLTIGNSKFVDVYSPDRRAWVEAKGGGRVMVTSHAVLGRRLFCVEWKDERKLSVFDALDGSWKTVPVPVTGSSRLCFRLATLGGKLLLLSLCEAPEYQTLVYDPEAPAGCEWTSSSLCLSGLCSAAVSIKA